MTRKNTLPNSGIPLFVDHKRDLLAKPGYTGDSWYVKCSFEDQGKMVGFIWHQMLVQAGPQGKVSNAELLLMESTEQVVVEQTLTVPLSERSGASEKECNVYSPLGRLREDNQRFILQLAIEDGAVDVVLKPRKEVLYNGALGLLKFGLFDQSYEYAYPNMEIEGTVTIKGKEYHIHNTTAWLDRQWVDRSVKAEDEAWLWLGMTLNAYGSESISLWDNYGPGKHNAFTTLLTEDGMQLNAVANITYDKIWTSSHTGNHYPGQVHIAVPAVDLDFTMTVLLDKPEFVREHGASGCESLYAVQGSYKGTALNFFTILEMVGDLCGEEA